MATIALGIVGAAVGSAFGNPYGGFMIGSTIGSLIDASANAPHIDANRVADLRYSGSTYGNAIPWVWGYVRVPGNVVWVAKDANGNHLIEHQSTQGGGKGAPTVTNYTYTASLAVAFCAGTLTLPDGSQVSRNVALKRLWADDLVIWDAAAETNPAVDLTFYPGSETQDVDALIASVEGAGNSPAYRGLAYAVLTDLLLTNFGNRIPNFSAELTTDAVAVGDAFSDLARASGLAAADLDLSQATMSLTGLALGSVGSAQDALTPVLGAYNLDAAEVDGVLRLVARGGAASLTIDPADLGSSASGGQTPTIEVKRLLESELPGRVDLTYFDTDRSLQQATQSAERQSANVQNIVSTDLGLSLDATTAARMAATALDNAWVEVGQQTFTLPQKYLGIAPADVLLVPIGNGLQRVRVTALGLSDDAEIRVSTVSDDPGVLVQTVTGDPGTGGPGAAPPAPVGVIPTDFVVWSGTEIRDADQSKAGFYVAATGNPGWQGGQIFYSPDGGASWVAGGPVKTRATFGVASGALPDGGAALTFDDADTATVVMTQGEPEHHAPDVLIERAERNYAVFGSEILGFGNADLVTGGTYHLSHLYRGMRGSSMTGHADGDLFVLADSNVVRVPVDGGYVGETLQVKVLSQYQQLTDVTAKNVTIGGRTPTQVEVQVDTLTTDLTTHEGLVASPTVLGHVKVGSGLAIDGGGVLSASGAGLLARDVFAGDGSTTAFTTAAAPGGMELVFLNGLLQQPGGVDYAWDAGTHTATFVAAPSSGDAVAIVY